jgi:hypothetical protein
MGLQECLYEYSPCRNLVHLQALGSSSAVPARPTRRHGEIAICRDELDKHTLMSLLLPALFSTGSTGTANSACPPFVTEQGN